MDLVDDKKCLRKQWEAAEMECDIDIELLSAEEKEFLEAAAQVEAAVRVSSEATAKALKDKNEEADDPKAEEDPHHSRPTAVGYLLEESEFPILFCLDTFSFFAPSPSTVEPPKIKILKSF